MFHNLLNTFVLMYSTNLPQKTELNVDNDNANSYELTPILSVFYPGNGSIVSSPQAQLTCLKVVGPSEDLDTFSTGLAPKAVAVSFTRVLVGVACAIVTTRLFSGRG